jgi:hypothetical protein
LIIRLHTEFDVSGIKQGILCQLEVQASLVEADSVLFEQSVTDNIGISNKHDASSQRKSYLNRLIVPLSVTQALLSFKAKDLNSQTSSSGKPRSTLWHPRPGSAMWN